jgi:hypothetical protein
MHPLEITKTLRGMWKELTADEKKVRLFICVLFPLLQKYDPLVTQDKIRYAKEKAEYDREQNMSATKKGLFRLFVFNKYSFYF